MRRKMTGYDAFLWLLLLCLSSFYGFFRYLPLGKSIYFIDYINVTVLLLCFVFFLIMIPNGRVRIQKNYGALIFSFVGLIIVEIIWTTIEYGQPIIYTLMDAYYYVPPIVTVLVFVQFRKQNRNPQYLEDCLVKSSIACSLVAIIAFALLQLFSINILQIDVTNLKWGTARFDVGSMFIQLAFIISITRMSRYVAKKIDRINVAVSLIQFLLINKTRTLILYLAAVILAVILIEREMKKGWKIIIWTLLVGCIFAGAFLSTELIGSINDYIYADAGIAMRLNTIDYYMKQFWQKPILGMGFLSSRWNTHAASLINGYHGYFYRSDVGVVGLLNEFGICGLLWVCCFFRTFIKQFWKSNNVHEASIRNIIIFLMISMINLSFLDIQRMYYMFIVYALGISTSAYNKDIKKMNEPSILIPQQSWGEQSSCSVAQSNKRKPPMVN